MQNCVKAGGASGPESVTDGTTLTTGINLREGQRLTITQVDPADRWSAGSGEERTGNADVLSAFGDYAVDEQAFPFGSLDGQIDNGDYFFVGTRYSGLVEQDGALKLMYWDDRTHCLVFSSAIPFCTSLTR